MQWVTDVHNFLIAIPDKVGYLMFTSLITFVSTRRWFIDWYKIERPQVSKKDANKLLKRHCLRALFLFVLSYLLLAYGGMAFYSI